MIQNKIEKTRFNPYFRNFNRMNNLAQMQQLREDYARGSSFLMKLEYHVIMDEWSFKELKQIFKIVNENDLVKIDYLGTNSAKEMEIFERGLLPLKDFFNEIDLIELKAAYVYEQNNLVETYLFLQNNSYISKFIKQKHIEELIENHSRFQNSSDNIESKLGKSYNKEIFELTNLVSEFENIFCKIDLFSPLMKLIKVVNHFYNKKKEIDYLRNSDFEAKDCIKYGKDLWSKTNVELNNELNIEKPKSQLAAQKYMSELEFLYRSILHEMEFEYSIKLENRIEELTSFVSEFKGDFWHKSLKALINSPSFGLGTRFEDFINPKATYEGRIETFRRELAWTISNERKTAIVAIIQNPSAKKYKWEIWGAFDFDEDNWHVNFCESIDQAAAHAYRQAKLFQKEKSFLTKFISIKNQEEDDFNF